MITLKSLTVSALVLAVVSCAYSEQLLYKTLRSQPVTLTPGGVYRRFQTIPWASGHIGIRSFNGELVYENGKSVPLSDVYLHHWIVARAMVKDSDNLFEGGQVSDEDWAKIQLWPNAGTCENGALSQWFGVGSETRQTDVSFPAPYGVESGNPDSVSEGWHEQWLVQIHAIDTRGAVNPADCLECRCDAYNATVSEHGFPLPDGYKGGLWCCYENVTCATKPDYPQKPVTFYLQYTISYVPFDSCVVPVRIYILDVTDNGLPYRNSTKNSCQVEYAVEPFNGEGPGSTFLDARKQAISFPNAGSLVYTVGHLHAAGVGVTLWAEDGRVICDSRPIYGQGSEPGDEAGYVVGMGVCRHNPARDRVTAGEKLTIRSTYQNDRMHTGVMGLMYMAVAVDEDYTRPADGICPGGKDVEALQSPQKGGILGVDPAVLLAWSLGGGSLIGLVLAAAMVAVEIHRKRKREQYVPLVNP